MRKLVKIIVERRPAVSKRITCLVVSGRGHYRHLAQELGARSEVIVIPVAIISFAADEIAVHESDVTIQIAYEILHVRPVVSGITVNITNREDTISCAGFRSRFGETDFIATPFSIRTYGEIITGVGLKSGECNDMHITFTGHIPSAIGVDLLIEVFGIGAVINERVSGFCLFIHLPKDLDGIGGRAHRIGHFVRHIRIIAVVVFFRRNAPTRIAEITIVCSCANSRAVFEQLEITGRSIYKIRIAVQISRLCSPGA